MKRFIRTLAGKTTLFIVCIVSFCIFAVGVGGIILYTQNDLAFYRLSEQELIRDFLVNDRLRPVSFSLLWNRLSGTPETRDGYEYRILDGNGGVLAESECCDALDAAAYTFTYCVLRDAEGNLNAIVYLYTDQPNDENA